jgi:adenylate cyclase
VERSPPEERTRSKPRRIEFDLAAFQILLRLSEERDPLVLSFDKPARRFYFSLIALIAIETKRLGRAGFIHIRKHEATLIALDRSLAGRHASQTLDGMWEKVRHAWHYHFPDLETPSHFKIEDRTRIAPYEKGGKYRYECSEAEADAWAGLFQYDEENRWRFKLAIDSAGIDLNEIEITFGDLRGQEAWEGFLKSLSVDPSERVEKPVEPVKPNERIPVEPAHPEAEEHRKWNLKWSRYITAVAASAAILAAAGGLAIRSTYFSSPPVVSGGPEQPSLIVLPFANPSADPEQGYLSDGITEELIAVLSRLPKLRVIARNSAFTYKGKSVRVEELRRELGVSHVLEGSVQKSGNRARVSVQLIDAASGLNLWSERYERDLTDIFALEDEIMREVITALGAEVLYGDWVRLLARGTANQEAYLKCLEGRYYVDRGNPLALRRARELLLEATALDPGYALPYAFLAHLVLNGRDAAATDWVSDSLDQAVEWAEKSVALAPDNEQCHVALGRTLQDRKQYEEAEAAYARALALSPSCTLCNQVLGRLMVVTGGPSEAIPLLKKAMLLDPRYYASHMALGSAYEMMECYEEAIACLEKALSLTPESHIPLIHLAGCHAALGNEKEARRVVSLILKSNPTFSLKKYAEILPHKDEVFKQRYIANLRKAGLPE